MERPFLHFSSHEEVVERPSKRARLDPEVEKEQEMYCLCGKPMKDDDPGVIGCDFCEEWFHAKCLRMSDAGLKRALQSKKWRCPKC